MINIAAAAPSGNYKRRHLYKNNMKEPLHPETKDRLVETGLSLDDFALANERRHLFKCLKILKTYLAIQADQLKEFGRTFFISKADIASAANACRNTVKKAFLFVAMAEAEKADNPIQEAINLISLQLAEAFILCSYCSKRNKEILSIASLPSENREPTIKEQRASEELEAVKELRARIAQDKVDKPIKERGSVRLRPWEKIAYLHRAKAPQRWREVLENVLKRIGRKVDRKKVYSETFGETIRNNSGVNFEQIIVPKVRGQVNEYQIDRSRPYTQNQIEEMIYGETIGGPRVPEHLLKQLEAIKAGQAEKLAAQEAERVDLEKIKELKKAASDATKKINAERRTALPVKTTEKIGWDQHLPNFLKVIKHKKKFEEKKQRQG